jgi:hypothetical protein
MAFNNNAELSQLVTMFAGPLLGQMAGPGNFVPHMMPGQALMDQFAMRNYQNQTRNASLNLAQAGPQNQDVANRLLGMRSVFTGSAPTDMNREQATQMAQVLNNPMTKTFAGMMMGPENVERLLHGSRGDVQSLGNTVNRIGYFRKDPGGGDRMDAESLEDLTTGVFSHLYEPQGDTEKLARTARAGGTAGATAQQRLQKAAGMEDRRVVSDADVQSRLENAGGTRVEELYKKYVQGGTATDTATQAKELTRFDRAIKESKVLATEEATIGQLETAAFKQPTAEMHGLTAGQSGQLLENLFQRGVIPPTVGNLDAKGKVGAIAETKLDDATLQRLAETMARRQLTEKNEAGAGGKKFTDMQSTDQQKEIDALVNKTGGTKEQINATRAEAEKTARGDAGAKSAEDVMQMAGGEALAGNVDASRTSSRLKDYAESVSAIRDIFGDNGNPNAPMPALMAALDHLTQGGMGAMDPKRTATTLRQMQTMARETGTGMQQMAAMSQQAGALGQQLGIAPSITMQNVAMSMGMTKTAMDRGAFSNNTPGSMTKEQFQAESVERLQRGDASDNAKAMAAMRRIYEADPEKFKGTELESAVAAYKDRSSGGNYKYDPTPDKPKSGDEVDRNLFEGIGRGQFAEAQRLIQESGGSEQDFYANVYDKRTATEEFMMSGAGFMTQKHDVLRDLSQHGAGGTVTNALDGTALGEELEDYGGTMGVGDALTEMVLDSSNMGVNKQTSFLQKHMPQKLAEHFQRQGMGKDEAKKMADRVVSQTFGTNDKGEIDKSAINRLMGNVGIVAEDFYGKNLVELNQLYGNQGDVKGMQEMAKSEAHAHATKRLVGLGSESTPMGRMSDYFMDIGKRGEKFDMGNFIKEMSPIVGNQEILQRYAGEMGAGMHTLSSMRDKVQVSGEHVDKLAKDGDIDELKRLGGVTGDEVIVNEAKLKEERDRKLAGMEDEDVAKEYARIRGLSGPEAGKHIDIKERRAFLASSEQFAQDADEAYLTQQYADTGKQHLSVDALKMRAMRSVGTALQGKEGQQEDIETVQRALFHGDDENTQKAAVSAVGRLFKDEGGAAGKLAQDSGKLAELMSADGTAGTDAILKQLGLSKEQFEKDKSLETKDKSAEQKLAEVMTSVQRADEQQQMDKVTDEKTAQTVAQKADKVELDAQNVYINGAKAGGGSEQIPNATPQAPGSPMPPTKDAIDAEIEAINKKEGHWLYDKITDADKARREELIKQRDTVAEQEKAAAPTPAADAAGKTADKPLPETKTADKDPAVAADINQKTAETAVQATGVTHDEAKAIIAEDETRTAAEKNDANLQQQAGLKDGEKPTADAVGPPKEEKRYTADEWAELHSGEHEEDAFGRKQPRTPVSQHLPDGDYERVNGGNYVNKKTGEQFDRYGNPADGTYSADGNNWTAGNAKEPGAEGSSAVSPSDTQQQPMPSGPNHGGTRQKPGTDRRQAHRTYEQNERTKEYANAGGNRPQQHLIATDIEQEIAAALPLEKTAGVQQSTPGQIGSANIQPVAYSPEQQPPRGGEYSGQAASQGGGGDNGSITLNGSLRLEGLHEAILDATAQKAVASPGGGPPIVGTGQMGRGGLPSGHRTA